MKKNPKNWSSVEWNNCYQLYKSTQLYELDDYIGFDEFKIKVLTDKNFRILNQLRKGMDNKDYNPWKT
jgi:hypothetical protein